MAKKGLNINSIKKKLDIATKNSKLAPPEDLMNPGTFMLDSHIVTTNKQAGQVLGNLYREIISVPAVKLHHSEKHLEEEIRAALLEALLKSDTLAAANNLNKRLTSSNVKITAVVPLDGIYFKNGRSLALGKVELEKYSATRAKAFSHGQIKVTKGKGTKVSLGNTLFTVGWPDTYAIVEYQSSIESAYENSVRIVEEELNALRFLLLLVNYPIGDCQFGIKGRVVSYKDSITYKVKSTGKLGIRSQLGGPISPLKFNRKLLSKIRNSKRYHKLTNILKKEYYKLNDFEKRVLHAVNWIGKSHKETEPLNIFIFSAIALEALFSVGNSDLTEHLAICISKILAANSSSSRVTLYEHAKKLYTLRSKIVHTGRYHISKMDADGMRRLAYFSAMFAISKLGAINDDSAWVNLLKQIKVR